jgi:hypothetical protein
MRAWVVRGAGEVERFNRLVAGGPASRNERTDGQPPPLCRSCDCSGETEGRPHRGSWAGRTKLRNTQELSAPSQRRNRAFLAYYAIWRSAPSGVVFAFLAYYAISCGWRSGAVAPRPLLPGRGARSRTPWLRQGCGRRGVCPDVVVRRECPGGRRQARASSRPTPKELARGARSVRGSLGAHSRGRGHGMRVRTRKGRRRGPVTGRAALRLA